MGARDGKTRLSIAYLVDDGADAKTVLHELPKHHVILGMKQGLESNVSMIEAGVLRPVVDTTFPMSRIVDAHRRVEGRHKRGTVVVTIAA